MTKTLHGKVCGNTIQFSELLGVADGQEVEVQITTVPIGTRQGGDGFLRTEGALADDVEWDDIMDEIHAGRMADGTRQIPDLGNP